jgi:hypothetical protein
LGIMLFLFEVKLLFFAVREVMRVLILRLFGWLGHL